MLPLAPTTPVGRAGLAAILADPAHVLAAFDYDGTLAPIVDDPAAARAEPGVMAALAELANRIGQVAVITGRPAGTAVAMAGADDVAEVRGLVLLGHYGLERWDAPTGRVTSVDPPPGLAVARREIADVIEGAGVLDADVEDKGLALAVHVRRSAAPSASYQKLVGPLLALADRTGLTAEPGRLVVELRPAGMDKGRALLGLAAEVGARTLMVTGDDLGDLAAFDAVDSWRAAGRSGLLVCSGSAEVTELASRADLVVDGPAGVLALVHQLTAALPARPPGP